MRIETWVTPAWAIDFFFRSQWYSTLSSARRPLDHLVRVEDFYLRAKARIWL